MKRLLCCILAFIMLVVLVACNNSSKTEYHPSGFDGEKLYVNIDGQTHIFERYEAGIGSLTKKAVLDTFSTETEIEGSEWEVYSTEEYPDRSYVLVISGTNSAWTYRILKETP